MADMAKQTSPNLGTSTTSTFFKRRFGGIPGWGWIAVGVALILIVIIAAVASAPPPPDTTTSSDIGGGTNNMPPITDCCATRTCAVNCPAASPAVLGGNSGALPLAGFTTTCTCSGVFDSTTSSCDGVYTATNAFPITVTHPISKDTKTIMFTSSYSCAAENTCDYSVPFDCTKDGTTCTKWADCNNGSDTTCGFTVKDMTLYSNNIKLQNESLNGGNYSSISITNTCP